MGVHRDPMRGDELTRPLTFFRVAEARLQPALEVVDAHAVAQPGSVVHAAHAVQLTDEEIALRVQANAVRPMNVVPHGDELAVGVEDLDAMGLSVGDIDVIVAVDDDIVRPDELAGVDTRLAPRQDESARWGAVVDAAVAVAV